MTKKAEFKPNLSLLEVLLLFAYFTVLIIGGIILVILTMLSRYSDTLAINSFAFCLIGSIGSCLMGGGIYYLRKIYKFSLADKFINSPENKFAKLATLFYFYTRPLFGICFTLICILTFNSGLITITQTDLAITNNYIDLLMVLSFIIGFCTGDILSKFEDESSKLIEKLITKKEL